MITGNNNIVGNNNNVNTATTTTSATNGTAIGATDARTSTFTGSNGNNLREGLRSGTQVTLTGSGERASFIPPTGRMGNGEADRAMTLANRDLRSAGINNPTPQQTEAALMGGKVTNGQGESTDMPGVLQLRSQGMGWGQIANTIGVHPSQSGRGEANSMRGHDRGQSAGAAASIASSQDRFSRTQASGQSREADRSQGFREGSRMTGSAAAQASVGAHDRFREANSAGTREHDNRSIHAHGRSDERKNDRASIAARDNGNGGAGAGADGHAGRGKH